MSSANQPFRGSPYAQEFISHLQPYCTTYRTGRGEQFDLQVNGQGMLPPSGGDDSDIPKK